MGATWSRQRVIEKIGHWHARGVGVDQLWRQSRTLLAAAYAHCGSWRAALQAAGLESVRQRWSRERVLRELRAHYAVPGNSAPWKDVDTRLKAAATRYFGSWQQALVAARLRAGPPRHQRKWTQDEILHALRARQQDGAGLSAVWRTDPRLYAVAKRRFGSWRAALQAAGCPMPSPRTWSAEEVLREIERRQADGQPLTGVCSQSPPLYNAAKRHFGSWRSALAAAGITPRPCQRWTKATIVQSLRRRHEQGPPLSHTWTDDKPLFRAAVRKFGSWHGALRAAGLETRPYRKWSRERVVDALRSQYRQHRSVARRWDPALAGAAYRCFGSLARALDAAGLEPPPRRWTRPRIIEQIQDGHVRKRPMHQAGLGDRKLAAAAQRHFGSWRAAVTAAGLGAQLPPELLPRRWSPQAVIDEIVDAHRRGDRPTDLWKRDTGLVSAAKKHFGSWRAAVLAAGLKTTRRQWSPAIVIRELQARHTRGQGLSSSVVFRQDGPLGAAALRYFGSWPAALAAAGLPPTRPTPAPRKPRTRNSACSAKK